MAHADKIGSTTSCCCKGHLRKERPKQPVRQLPRTRERQLWRKEVADELQEQEQ